MATEPPSPLSPRLQQVLQLCATGQTNKGIAQTLGISHHTVDSYLRDLYRCYNVRSRVEAVLVALRYQHLNIAEITGGSTR